MRSTLRLRGKRPSRKTATPVARHLDFVPGLGLVPDTAGLLEVVDAVWTPALEAAWASEVEQEAWEDHGDKYVNRPSEVRIVARYAVGQWAKQWRRDCGPEWCASQGVPVGVIAEYLGRPPRPDGEVYPPPTVDDVREVLADGWLLRFWRGESVDAQT